MNPQHKTIRVVFGVVVAAATVLLNTLSVSATQVDQSVVTDAPVVEAPSAIDAAPVAATETTAAAPVANEAAIPSSDLREGGRFTGNQHTKHRDVRGDE